MAYKVFKRSARNFNEFANATKYHVQSGLTYEEAQNMCRDFNDNRTSAQIKRGTKYEFQSG